MSSAFYPQGMKSYNNHVNPGNYKTWKGRGIFSNPVGMASGNMRPLTNNDPANNAMYKVGSQRPLRHYRIGRSIRAPVVQEDQNNPGTLIESYYYSDREVKSSTPGRLIGQLIDRPGNFIVKPNVPANPQNYTDEEGLLADSLKIPEECNGCRGIAIVSNWMPINDLTEKPQAITQTPKFCCNAEYKARRRVLPANTVLKKNYYTSNAQYLYNRCQTFEQRQFNFLTGSADPTLTPAQKLAAAQAKPGSALSVFNLYVANCNPNIGIPANPSVGYTGTETSCSCGPGSICSNSNCPNSTCNNGCKRVYYKPNNAQFAKQGAVSSSTRTFKANVVTIEKNIANRRRDINAATNFADNTNFNGTALFAPFVYKLKTEKCNPAYFTKDGNPKTCFRGSNDRTLSYVDYANASI